MPRAVLKVGAEPLYVIYIGFVYLHTALKMLMFDLQRNT